MDKGTKLRTILRIAFSIYTGFCMWQVSITELSQQLNAPWLVAMCAVVIVLSGLVVDIITTWFNNNYTKEACEGTGITRQLKRERKKGYNGEVFFGDTAEVCEEGEDDEQ